MLSLIHIWYSWYVFGYDTSKNDYRMFKVVRMKNISLTKELFQSNDNIADLLSDFEKRRNQTNITVVLSYKKEIDTLVNEYFKGEIVEIVNECFIKMCIRDSGCRGTGWTGLENRYSTGFTALPTLSGLSVYI